MARIQQDLKAAHLTFSQVYKPDPKNRPQLVQVEGIDPNQSGAVRSVLDNKYSNEYDIAGNSADNGFTVTMKPLVLTALEKKTDEEAIETIRDRVDSLGVSEPVIQEYGLGDNEILVELPGISDLDRVKEIIQSTARLEIHAVLGGPFPDEQAALASVGGTLPPDQELVHGSGALTGSEADSVYLLQRVAIVAGSDFRSADPGTDQNGMRTVRFTLTNEAGDRSLRPTPARTSAGAWPVVMGGRVREVANIESAIRDSGEIRGSFTPEEVEILSKMLRTGALPASLHYIETSTVGASLGADSIRQGVTAAIVGVLVVMAFMLFYSPRLWASTPTWALFLNLVILLGFMGFSQATLTLPGIAGVILTIGMGVDSNVLIFERIREEMRAGKPPSAAVDQGFAHAWTTIFDTHVTTIVSAAILFLFWHRSGQGLRSDADFRFGGQSVHGSLRLAGHLRGAPEQVEAGRIGFDLEPCGETARVIRKHGEPEPTGTALRKAENQWNCFTA